MTCDSGKPFILPDKTPKAITSKCKCPKDPKLNWVNLFKKVNKKIYLEIFFYLKNLFFLRNEDVGGLVVKWAELSIRQIFLLFNVNLN